MPCVLLPSSDLGDGHELGDTLDVGELDVYFQLSRRWLLWRDVALRGGTTDRDPLLAEVVARQHAWLREPSERYGGATPLATMLAARTPRPKPRPPGRGRKGK